MFCDINRIIQCLVTSNGVSNLIESTRTDTITIRRFGINSDGAIEYDIYGEPINLNAQQNYLELYLTVRMYTQDEINDEESKIGGKPDDKEYIMFEVGLTDDIQQNDIVEYPQNSNKTYRVTNDKTLARESKRVIKAYYEYKATE